MTKSMKKFVVVVFLFWVSLAFGHDLFLNAHPFILDKPGTVEMAMNLAEAFPGNEVPWRFSKTLKFWIGGPQFGRELASQEGMNPKSTLPNEGTYVVGWNSNPSYIEIDAKTFGDYIKMEGYQNVIDLRKKTRNENTPGREKYVRFLKSIVQVGMKRTTDFSNELGQKMEIIPLRNP
jgi:uncharacterized GH25 family protein